MDRRELLTGGAAALASLALSQAAAAAEAAPHEHHHHDADPRTTSLAATAADCIQTGQVCLNHCLVLLKQGDKSMAACAQSVMELLSVCGALQSLANAKSRYLPQMAKVALEACRDCSAECKKYADKHEECKACMESCDACVRECKAISA